MSELVNVNDYLDPETLHEILEIIGSYGYDLHLVGAKGNPKSKWVVYYFTHDDNPRDNQYVSTTRRVGAAMANEVKAFLRSMGVRAFVKHYGKYQREYINGKPVIYCMQIGFLNKNWQEEY